MKPLAAVLAAAILLSGCAPAGMVTERWGAAGTFRHGESATYESPAEGGGVVVKFDLSALAKGTRIYRARLLPGIAVSGAPLNEPVNIQALTRPPADGAPPTVAEKPLELVPPRFLSFDATDVVSRWVSGKLANNGLWIRGAKISRVRTCLEITYEGRLKDPPPAVTGLKAFYRAGQVFLTWNEVNSKFAGKQDVTWGELKGEVERIRDGKGSIITYRIYRHTRPITPASLGQAELADEVGQHSAFDEREIRTEWKGEQIKNVRVGDARVPRTAVQPKTELPVGTGVFVATCRKASAFYYAVVAAADGVENTSEINDGNSLPQPLHEQVATTEPILFSEGQLMYQKRPQHCYVWWVEEPLNNQPNFIHLSVSPPPKDPSGPVPLVVNNYWWSSGWAPSVGCPIEEGASLTLDQNPMTVRGIHDGCGTCKAWSQGKVQGYFIRQFRALLPWLKARYNIDEDRMYAISDGWAWRYPDLFAACFEALSMNPKRSPAEMECKRYWNDPKTPAPTEWGTSAWEYWNVAEWVKANPTAEMPLVTYALYQHTGDFGTLDKPPFCRAMLETKRSFAAIFEEGRLSGVQDDDWVFQIRRSDSLAAFTRCTLDDDPGIGAGGDPGAQINSYLCFDARSGLDEPEKWEMTVYLYAGQRGRRGAPVDACTADVTPRRCRKFKAAPGQKFTWTNTSLAENKVVQTGTATADQWGLVTAEKVVISKGKNRLSIQRQ